MNRFQKYKLYKKMIVSDQALYDINKKFIGSNAINIKYTFLDAGQVYKVSAYKISFGKWDHAYTVNIFRNNKHVALFAGQGKARKLIDHVMAIHEKSR